MTGKSYIILLASALCLSACAQKNNNAEDTATQSEEYTDSAVSVIEEGTLDASSMVEEETSSASTTDDAASTSTVTEESTSQSNETDNSSESSADKAPVIVFDTTMHNFGKVKLGESKTFEFTFKNTGDADLYIVDSNVFCSCMKLTLPKEPIAPGQTGKIIMKFTGEQPGSFMKNAQVYTNCKRPMVRINIEGEVIE